MPVPTSNRRRGDRGQAIVILTVSVAAVLAMTALIVDGGNAMAQQRGTQNGSDASAYAGASVLVEKMSGTPRSDADVYIAVLDALADNDTTLVSAEYVNFDNAAVGTVGSSGAIPSSASGVRVNGSREFGTYFAGVVGLNEAQTTAQATAMAGALSGVCSAQEGCAVAPVTFSIPITTCDGTNRALRQGEAWPLVSGTENANDANMSIVPLCTNGPGGVGWLDMSQVGCPGGNISDWIVEPCNRAFDVPIWLQTQPGNVNNVEAEMNTHRGKIILVPMFDATCRDVPSSGLPEDCGDPGQGNNLWYHIPQFAAFLLYEAYIQGNDRGPCNSLPGQPASGGNGSTSCMKGWFLRYISVGPVAPCDVNCQSRNPLLGIQLVR